MSMRIFLQVAAMACILSGIYVFGQKLLRPEPPIPVQDALPGDFALDSVLRPLELPAGLDQDKVELGRQLFLDTRLSKDNTVSCHSCHQFQMGGADGRQFSVGINGVVGSVNSPTVYNSIFNFKQFWDGRAGDLREQADGPVHNPIEMSSNWDEAVSKLKMDALFAQKFLASFPGGLNKENLKAAIVEFEKSLVTLNSPFDRYLRGDEAALSKRQISGYQKFDQYGCISCHQGKNVGGNMFQTMGLAFNYFEERGGHFPSDAGRYAVTKNKMDLHVFKVPSLRNVALTAPYFHDGSEPSLEEAVRKMARYQLGRKIPDPDVRDIADFLRALTGEAPASTQTGGKFGTAQR